MVVNNSTNINKRNNYLSPQIIEFVEKLFVTIFPHIYQAL
jgi:hypothetical protein